jgi:hypothetical protein
MSFLDVVVQFGAVVSSAIAKETLDITLQVLGIGGIEGDDADGEASPAQVNYGPLGLLSRPLPPDVSTGKTRFADVVCLKTSDGLLPIAWRDLRINAAFPDGVKEGTVAFAGYGGGFYSLDLTSGLSGSQKANIHVIYCPYSYSGTTPGKAHAIVLDPTTGNESVSITHGSGYQVSLTHEGVNINIDSSTFLCMTPGTFTVNAAKIILQGNVAVGHNAAVAIPFSGGPAMPPSSSFFYSTP